MRRLAISSCILLFAVFNAGCATSISGVYVNSPSVFGGRSIRLEENGQFSYFLWSDDLEEECEANGTWSKSEKDKGFVVTQINERKQSNYGGWCEEMPDMEK